MKKLFILKEIEYTELCNSMKEDCSNFKYKDVGFYEAFIEDNDCDIE